MKKSKILSLLLALGLAAGALAGCGQEEEQEESIVVYGYEEDKSEYVMENEHLKFVMNPATTQFTLTEKKTGNVWYSNPPEGAEDSIANKATKQGLQSTLMITYGTTNGVTTVFNSYGYSVENGLYEIEEVENGIKVKYSIGNIERAYIMPPALPESSFMVWYDKMDSSTKRRLTSITASTISTNCARKITRVNLWKSIRILKMSACMCCVTGCRNTSR